MKLPRGEGRSEGELRGEAGERFNSRSPRPARGEGLSSRFFNEGLPSIFLNNGLLSLFLNDGLLSLLFINDNWSGPSDEFVDFLLI